MKIDFLKLPRCKLITEFITDLFYFRPRDVVDDVGHDVITHQRRAEATIFVRLR